MHVERPALGREGSEGTDRGGSGRPDPAGERLFRALFDHLEGPMILCEALEGADGRIRDLVNLASNPAHDRVMGQPPGAMVGRTARELNGDGAAPLVDAAAQVLSTGGAQRLRTRYHDGRIYEITVFRVDARTVGIGGDEVTARVHAEEERERLLHEREELVRTISHDLRAPLTSISSQAQLLAREPESERVAVKARAIAANARRMAQMIGDLVDTARADAGVPLDRAPLELGSFLSELVSRLDGGIEAARVRVSVPDGLPSLRVDPARFERVIVNLLANALRHGPPGTPVELTATAGAGAVTIEVADRGPGIAPDDLPRIFDRFYRARAGGEGLGLGLHIARLFVEAHGGTLEARNEPGCGAVFRVTLPLAPPEG